MSTPHHAVRLSRLEAAMADLAEASAESKRAMVRFSTEMLEFKKEMRDFKDEMGAFKDEMGAFKQEMLDYKNETRAEQKQFRKQLGELANKFGTLAEDIVAPNIADVFMLTFHTTSEPQTAVRQKRWHHSDPSKNREFDAFAFSDDVFLLFEVKSRLAPENIPSFLQVLEESRDYLTEIGTRKLHGGFATFSLDPALVAGIERQGLFAFGLGGGMFEPLNSEGFLPKAF